MNDKDVCIGGKLYPLDRIKEIESVYGKGFLRRNPHYPAPGIYQNLDGSQSFPRPLVQAPKESE